ncbi:MAG: hypothetical protein KDA32_06960 [Phycisphaerales bacterium]|nr:hypothetical protein [Phycisphaerales bacterium]
MEPLSPELHPAILEAFGRPLELLAAHGFRVRQSHFDARHFGNFAVDFTGRCPNFRVIRDRSEYRIEAEPELKPPLFVYRDPIELVGAILLWAGDVESANGEGAP